MNDRTQVETIRAASDIVSVIGDYVPLKRLGRTSVYARLCTLSYRENAIIPVDRARQRWHCFGCGADGDVFEFIQRIEGVSFAQATEILASRAGIEIRRPALSPDDKRRYARAKESADRLANDLTAWRRSLINQLRASRNAAWEAEQLACRIVRAHGNELCESDWEVVWQAVMLQPLGDKYNRALNTIEQAAADVLLRFYKQKQAA